MSKTARPTASPGSAALARWDVAHACLSLANYQRARSAPPHLSPRVAISIYFACYTSLSHGLNHLGRRSWDSVGVWALCNGVWIKRGPITGPISVAPAWPHAKPPPSHPKSSHGRARRAQTPTQAPAQTPALVSTDPSCSLGQPRPVRRLQQKPLPLHAAPRGALPRPHTPLPRQPSRPEHGRMTAAASPQRGGSGRGQARRPSQREQRGRMTAATPPQRVAPAGGKRGRPHSFDAGA